MIQAIGRKVLFVSRTFANEQPSMPEMERGIVMDRSWPMIMRLLVCAAVSFSALGEPAAAQVPVVPSGTGEKLGNDPNERICANITMTGSRLAVKRFCGTRAQWADKQLQDRQEVDRVQRSPCVYQATGATGRSSC